MYGECWFTRNFNLKHGRYQNATLMHLKTFTASGLVSGATYGKYDEAMYYDGYMYWNI